MTPQTVNAYYNPTTNDVATTAGSGYYPCAVERLGEEFKFNANAIGASYHAVVYFAYTRSGNNPLNIDFVDGELYKEEYFKNVDPYDLFLEGTQKPLFIIENENATTDKELIVYRDSFGSSLVPLLVEGYKKITVVDVRYMATSLIDSNNLIDYKDGQDVLFIYSTDVFEQYLFIFG